MNTAPLTRLTTRASWKIKKNSPQILMVAGIVGGVVTVGLSARAGAKTPPVLDRLADRRERLQAFHDEGELDDKTLALGVRQEYTAAGVELVKLYGPVVVTGVASVYCLTKSHSILSNRNAALTVAFTALDRAFRDYRGRVVGELGPEKDQEFLLGTVVEEVESTNSKGVTKTKQITKLDPNGDSPYSYLFDDKNPCWEKSPGYNATFLSNQQVWANDKLKIQGHLFLNEVYDLLRIPHTQMGQVVGWIYDADQYEGDGFVDFGFNRSGEFVAGYEPSVWLDFNVDGPILEKI